MTTEVERRGRVNGGAVGAGLIVLLLGVLMLLDRGGYTHLHLMRYFPGLACLAIGLGIMVGAVSCREPRHAFSGLWLVFIGSWLIVSEGRFFGLSFNTSWPLLIVAVGILIVLRALWPGRRAAERREQGAR